MLLYQRKYALDLLEETEFLRCKPASILMEANVDLWFDDSHPLDDPERYMRLIGKLIYLTVTRPYITFVVGVLSRFMHEHKDAHWLAALKFFSLYQELSRERLVYKKYGLYTSLDTLIQDILVTKEI